jgi:hypothetical protein
MIKFGSIRIYGVNRVNATDYGKYFLGRKRKQPKKKFKTQRNKFNNLKKQAKQRFYDNIKEHLDDLKTVNSQMYWKTIHMLLKNDRQSDGNTFSRKDLLNKLHNGFDISSFTDTNILLLIISGPTALLALRVHNISITSCSVTITWDIIFSHLS